jgi:hypothetical protein
MLASVSRRRCLAATSKRGVVFQSLRAKSTKQVADDSSSEGPIGKDGRHELWREGIYDHDNEPK